MSSPKDTSKSRKSIGQAFADALYEEGLIGNIPVPEIAPVPVRPSTVQPARVLAGHQTPVWCVATHGRLAVSGSGWHGPSVEDCTVRVWNLDSGTETHCLNGHKGHVRAVAISPDGVHAISGSDDRTIRCWNLQTGKEVFRYQGHENAVQSLAFGPSASWVVSGGVDKDVHFTSMKGQQIARYRGHADTIHGVSASPDGVLVASGGEDKAVRFWDLRTGAEVHCYKHNNWVRDVAFSPNGQFLLSAGDDAAILFDMKKRAAIRRIDSPAIRVAFSPDGGSFLVCTRSQVQLWEISKEEPCAVYLTGAVNSVSYCTDGKQFVTADYDKSVRLWDIAV